MNFSESFITALDSLMANKLRALLTMLGVIIGVAAVIALMSIGNGVNSFITSEIQSFGTNLLSVSTDPDNSEGYLSLSVSDVDALSDKHNAPAITAVTATIEGTEEVTAGGNSSRTSVAGITANYLTVNNLDDFQNGDGLTQQDLDTGARVAVIGSEAAEDLFEDLYPIGQTIKINGVGYEVVGVLEPSGSDFALTDGNVYIPLTTAHSRLFSERTRSGERAVTRIIAQAASEDQTDIAIEQLTETLRNQHGILYAADDDFTIFSQSDLLETFNTVTATFTAFLGAVAGISLVVGGIGIMNIMLVSVTERTREIGIRKAIGALRRDILAQFLLESMTLSVLGGLIGIALGWTMSFGVGQALDIQTVVNLSNVLLATGFASIVGVVFGLYPAWRASNLRPIDALRYE
jgi:putative ABC transport system permease protein